MNINDFSEWEKQKEFFIKLLSNDELDTIDFSNDTDGIIAGVLFEFKKDIANLHPVLFQAIKYLSSIRIAGKKCTRYYLSNRWKKDDRLFLS